jgi:hypothetical protein
MAAMLFSIKFIRPPIFNVLREMVDFDSGQGRREPETAGVAGLR